MRLWMLLLPVWLCAAVLQEGSSVGKHRLTDQFERLHEVGDERYWVVTWDRATTHEANLLFAGRPELLADKNAAMLVDISQTPSGILSLFVLPRMQGYAHPVLLSSDEAFNLSLPYEEGMITVLKLRDGRVETVQFAADAAALGEMLK